MKTKGLIFLVATKSLQEYVNKGDKHRKRMRKSKWRLRVRGRMRLFSRIHDQWYSILYRLSITEYGIRTSRLGTSCPRIDRQPIHSVAMTNAVERGIEFSVLFVAAIHKVDIFSYRLDLLGYVNNCFAGSFHGPPYADSDTGQ